MATIPGGPNTAENVFEPPKGGTPLPVGLYRGMIVKVENKEVKNSGVMLVIEFDITSPPEFSNRKFWERLNIVNASTKAVEIAKGKLSNLREACGIAVLSDSDQLIGKEVDMKLGIDPAKPYTDSQGNQKEGQAQNKCFEYFRAGSGTIASAAAPVAKPGWGAPAAAITQAIANPVAPATDVAPWKRNKA